MKSMYHYRLELVLLLVWMMGVASQKASGQRQYSLDEWMTISSVRQFAWMPDGKQFVYTSDGDDSGTREIFRVSSSGGEPMQLSVNVQGVRPEPKEDLVVSADGRTIYFTSAQYFQNYHNIFRMSSEGGPGEKVTFNDAVIETAPAVSPDGRKLAYFTRTSRGTKVYLLDLESQRNWPKLLEPGNGEERFPVWSPDGREIAFEREGDIWVRDLEEDAPRRLLAKEYPGGNSHPVWSPNGERIAFVASSSGYAQVGVVDVESGRVTPITRSENQHGDVTWSPDGQWLVFTSSDDMGMSTDVVLARADGSGIPKRMTSGKGWRSSPQFSPDGNWIAYLESAGNRSTDIWKIPARGGMPLQVTRSMGQVNPDDLPVPEELTYPGPDNLRIRSLMYKPKNFDPTKKYPVIVRLHGHPGQWNHSFQSMSQFIVQLGYVLIFPNPRGSVGFGQGYHDLHIGDYGGTEFEDVMRVLDYLKTLPYIDMRRKATWGGSGGGFMSLEIATKAPQAFEAQIIRAPVSTWRLLANDRFASSGRVWTATRTPRRERSEFGGSYAEIPEEYDERSPLSYVERVTVPQLLFQGLRDSSVPPRQSKVWVERMRALGKGHLIDYIEYADEDHSLMRYRRTVRDRLARMERFLAEHLQVELPEVSP